MLLLSAVGMVVSLVFLLVDFNANVESQMTVIKTLFAVGFVLGIPDKLSGRKIGT